MARIDFNPLQSVAPSAAPSGGFNINASPAAFGSDVARANQGLGATLAEVGDVANKHALAFQDLNNETYAKQADIDLQKRLTSLGYGDGKTPGYYATGGQAAFEGSKVTIEEAEKARDEVLNSLPNDGARRMFDAASMQRVQSFSESVSQHAAQGRKEWMIGTSEARAQESLNNAANYYNDENKVSTAIAVAKGEAQDQGGVLGWSSDQVMAQSRKYESMGRAMVIERMAIDDPLKAQEYYLKHIEEIDGAQHATIEKMLKSATTPILTSNIAETVMRGGATPNAELADVVAQAESGNRDFNKDGSVVTSPKGAKGTMQVMDATNLAPGFGVAPAKDDSLAERSRVGRDYLTAMLQRYGNQTVALAAYNWGPGKVDDVLARMGSAPGKSGTIDTVAFLAKTPPETRDYVAGINAKAPPKAGQPPTSDDVNTNMAGWLENGRAALKQAFPNDPDAVEQGVNLIEARGAEITRGQALKAKGASENLMSTALGLVTTPGGSYVQNPAAQRPTNLTALLATPQAKAAWDNLGASERGGVLAQLKQNAGGENPPENQASLSKYYELTGQAARDPDGFTRVNLADAALINLLPHEKLTALMGLQRGMMTKDARDAQKGANLQHALAVAAPIAKQAAVYYTAAPDSKNFDADKSKTYDQFIGRLQANLEAYVDANKKQPGDDDIRKMAGTLIMQGTERGTGWIWDRSAKLFEVGDPGKFAPTVPPEERTKIEADYRARYGKAPTPGMIEDIYKAHALRLGGVR